MVRDHAPASTVNPDAGNHPITADPVELEAARRASEETWNAWPYFEARYGERGRRFGVSDAGWLVTLCEKSRAEACEQVRWLAVVLASRGMPSITLEHNLDALHRQLCAAQPKRRKSYDKLQACAAALRSRRLERISDAAMREIAALMPGQPVAKMGELLVCAVADEANGIARAVSSMEEWLYKEGVPASWAAAAERTIAAARAAVTVSSRA